MLYSAQTGGFYPEDCTFIPEGAVEVSDADYAALFEGQAVGKWIVAGQDGKPTLADPADLATLDDVKADKITKLTADCSAAIVGGYKSLCLGSEHRYPNGVTDQINMMGSVTASLLPSLSQDWETPFWCEDSDGVWDFRPHTVAQIQQAGSDGKAHVVECQVTLATLSASVLAAADAAAVAAIVWPAG